MRTPRDWGAAAAAVAAVLVVLTLGFRFLGSPANQRAINSDERRIEDLRAIAQWMHNRPLPLPATLAETPNSPAHLTDPVTHVPYEYHATGTAYELCATFATVGRVDEGTYQPRSAFWNHPQGRYCFQLDSSQTAY
ncbi:MAG: hypothetical protein ACLP59_35515 [Bryobacteraceae bacterium]